MIELHEELRTEVLNIRIDKLSNKIKNKMKEICYLSKNKVSDINYKYSGYQNEEQPVRSRRKSLLEKIDKYIIQQGKTNPIKEEPSQEKRKAPTPIFTGKKQQSHNQ